MEITLENVPGLGNLPEVLEDLHKVAEAAPGYDKAKWIEALQLASSLEAELSELRVGSLGLVRQMRRAAASGKRVPVESYAGLLELLAGG